MRGPRPIDWLRSLVILLIALAFTSMILGMYRLWEALQNME